MGIVTLTELIAELQSKLNSFGDMPVYVPTGDVEDSEPVTTAWICSTEDGWKLVLTSRDKVERPAPNYVNVK